MGKVPAVSTNVPQRELPLLLNPSEAARRLGVNRKTVQRWLDDGTLTVAQTIGTTRCVLASDVEALAAKRADAAAAKADRLAAVARAVAS